MNSSDHFRSKFFVFERKFNEIFTLTSYFLHALLAINIDPTVLVWHLVWFLGVYVQVTSTVGLKEDHPKKWTIQSRCLNNMQTLFWIYNFLYNTDTFCILHNILRAIIILEKKGIL